MPPSGEGAGLLCSLGDVLLDVVVATRQDRGARQRGARQRGAPQAGAPQPGARQRGASRHGGSRHEGWQHGADTPAATRVAAGGQAANVASWVVALGGRARVVAKRAGDLAGQLVAADLRRLGVELAGPVTAGATGVVVSISEPGGERTMLTDRGVCPQLSAAELVDGWFAGCGRLHLPMYSLVDAPIREAALAAARRVPRVSVDLSSVSVLREIGVPEAARLLGLLAPEVIFGNEPESALLATASAAGAAGAAGMAGAAGVASAAAPGNQAGPVSGTTVIVKLGARGVLVNGRHWPARPAQAADSTGAGDAFAAGYLLGGVEMGLDAAARAVSQLGAMP